MMVLVWVLHHKAKNPLEAVIARFVSFNHCKKVSGFNSKLINSFTTFVLYLVERYPTKLVFNGKTFNQLTGLDPLNCSPFIPETTERDEEIFYTTPVLTSHYQWRF